MLAKDSMAWPIARRGVFALVAAVAALPVRGAIKSNSTGDWRELDRMAEAAVRNRLTPGLQVSVMSDGALIYAKGFGLANLETHTALTPSSVLGIGSLAKQFTAAAILLLAEDGLLRIDDPLSRFLPQVPSAGEITLRHLLTHTSGFGLSKRVPEAVIQAKHDSASLLSAILSARPALLHRPGTKWIYNNRGYNLLGLVIERASGETYSDFVRTRLTQRAGLTQTAVDQDRQVVLGRASGYTHDQGAAGGFRQADHASMGWQRGAGGMRSTANDLCRWHHALLRGRLLQRASLEAMTTPMLFNDLPPGTDVSQWGPQGPADRKQYGLGIYSGTHERRRLITHTGGTEGFLSQLTSYPDEKVTVAGIMNVDRGGGDRNSAHETAFRAMLQQAARLALS